MSGQASYNCPGIVANIAGSNGWPLSVDSHKFSEWANVVNWSLVKRGESKVIKEDFSLSFSGTIINFYN
jgi:hypothetical protein